MKYNLCLDISPIILKLTCPKRKIFKLKFLEIYVEPKKLYYITVFWFTLSLSWARNAGVYYKGTKR